VGKSIELPETGEYVLAKTDKGLFFVGRYLQRYAMEAHAECEDLVTEYSEEKDEYYYLEGWYEQSLWSDEYGFMKVPDINVVGWSSFPSIS